MDNRKIMRTRLILIDANIIMLEKKVDKLDKLQVMVVKKE